MTEVLFLPAAVKDLKKVPREVRQWVREATSVLAENPFIGTKLKLSLRVHCFKLRKGDYRSLYCYSSHEDAVYVLAVGHRSKVCREFYKRLK